MIKKLTIVRGSGSWSRSSTLSGYMNAAEYVHSPWADAWDVARFPSLSSRITRALQEMWASKSWSGGRAWCWSWRTWR
jgi:hypothetical protein